VCDAFGLIKAECQLEHWPTHKSECQNVARADAIILQAKTLPPTAAIQLLLREGHEFREQSRLEAALKLFQEGLDLAERMSGVVAENQAAFFYGGIGRIYSLQDRHSEALALHEKGYAITVRLFGSKHPRLARDLSNLASTYTHMGNYDQALLLQLEMLRIHRANPNVDLNDLAETHRDLAFTVAHLGKYEQALRYYREALAIHQRARQPDQFAIAHIVMGIGHALSHLGQDPEALINLTEAFDRARKIYGDSHPHVALTMHNIAIVLSRLGRVDEAKAMGIRAVKTSRHSSGPDHPDTLKYSARWMND